MIRRLLIAFLIGLGTMIFVWHLAAPAHAACIPDGECWKMIDSVHIKGEDGCSGVCDAARGDECETCLKKTTGEMHCDDISACDGGLQCTSGYTPNGTCGGGGGGGDPAPTNTPVPGQPTSSRLLIFDKTLSSVPNYG